MKMPDYPGDLKRGDSGPGVLLLQQLLCLHGDGVLCDGQFGPCTEAAVRFVQSCVVPLLPQRGSLVRAGFDRLTISMWLLANYKPKGDYLLDLGQLCHMALNAGIREFPQNRGPWVQFFMNGWEAPWCAGFATQMARKAGADVPVMWNCNELGDWAAAQERLGGLPSAGGLFLLPHSTGIGYQHTGIVAEVCGEAIRTIEGNSNDDGSANGERVVQRYRSSAGLMYVRLG